MLKSQISISKGGGGERDQLLILSPEMLKSQIPILGGGGQPTFDAESRNAKIANFHFGIGGGGTNI